MPHNASSGALQLLQQLSEPLPVSAVPTLRENIQTYVAEVSEAAHHNEFLDTSIVERLAAASYALLNDYPQLSAENRALIIGGIRYFLHTDDEEHDIDSLLGFDDDVDILNHVATTAGRKDLIITL